MTKVLSRRPEFLLLPAAIAFVWLHAATLGLGFIGDDFQWWQHAREALVQPHLLFVPYGGFRLVNTWTLVLDYLACGGSPPGYHLTNLVLYVASALLLWLVGRRFGLSPAARAAMVSLWLVSPYSFEPSVVVAQRFEPIQMMLWLGIFLLWPGPERGWTSRRSVAVVSLALLSALNKESWVVLPAFIVVLDVWVGRRRWRTAAVHGAVAGLAVAAYMAAYLSHPAIAPDSFYSARLANALKVPNAWAAFSLLTEVRPGGFVAGPAELAATLVIVALGVAAWRRRDALTAVGLALFVLPLVPLLPIGWSTSRYTTIPLAGFLLAAAGGVRMLAAALHPRWRVLVAPACTTAVLAVLAVNISLLVGDRDDYRRYAAAHQPLLAEAGRIAAEAAGERQILGVRLESGQPLVELSRSVAGIPKVFFTRGSDPYGLADWSALFSYVLDPAGGPLFADVAEPMADHAPCAVLGHVRGGFVWLERTAPDCAAAMQRWRDVRAPVRMFARWPSS